MITVKACDAYELEVEEAVAMLSGTIRRKVEADRDVVISLPDIAPRVLTKVFEYCTKHATATVSDAAAAAALKNWDANFIDVDQATLSSIILAADILDVKGLQSLCLSKKILTLRSLNGEEFMVEAPVALRMKTVASMLRHQPRCANSSIFLPNVKATVLYCVLEYCRKHHLAREGGLRDVDIAKLDQDFIKVYVHMLFDLIRAATYLEVEGLLELAANTAKTAAGLADLLPDEIVTRVIECHFTQEEEMAMANAIGNAI